MVYFIYSAFFNFYNFNIRFCTLCQKNLVIINRLATFIDAKGDKFQCHPVDAIKLGGLKGRNGRGILKESVPEAHTDYIIAIISEMDQ